MLTQRGSWCVRGLARTRTHSRTHAHTHADTHTRTHLRADCDSDSCCLSRLNLRTNTAGSASRRLIHISLVCSFFSLSPPHWPRVFFFFFVVLKDQIFFFPSLIELLWLLGSAVTVCADVSETLSFERRKPPADKTSADTKLCWRQDGCEIDEAPINNQFSKHPHVKTPGVWSDWLSGKLDSNAGGFFSGLLLPECCPALPDAPNGMFPPNLLGFTCPSGKEPLENVWKGTNLLSKSSCQMLLPVEPGSDGSRLPIGPSNAH